MKFDYYLNLINLSIIKNNINPLLSNVPIRLALNKLKTNRGNIAIAAISLIFITDLINLPTIQENSITPTKPKFMYASIR